MKPQTEAWVIKAEGDYQVLELLVSTHTEGDLKCDAICFHAQQCAEKYLKARLVEAEVYFEKTHDLFHLMECVESIEPDWVQFKDDLAYLSDFATAYRYPGDNATEEESRSAHELAAKFRNVVRESLGLAD
jgi:HEPN domain-containing protein